MVVAVLTDGEDRFLDIVEWGSCNWWRSAVDCSSGDCGDISDCKLQYFWTDMLESV